MRRSARRLTLAALLASGCVSQHSVGLPGTVEIDDTPIALGTANQLDLLFMVDNSLGMQAMQWKLAADLPKLMQALQPSGLALDLHLGVVTSDYGAGQGGGGCDASPGGQRGRLQAPGVAATSCAAAPDGLPFIRYRSDGSGNVVDANLPAGQTLLQTFQCNSAVGEAGCGFEHPLESVYAALAGDAVTSGFLRPDATLAVVFLTNEDDGSAPPTTTAYGTLVTAALGAFDTYRQTHFGIACNGQLAPEQADANLVDCGPATAAEGGQLYDVQRYITLLTQSSSAGGLKLDPRNVALFGIMAPTTPFATILADPSSGEGSTLSAAGAPTTVGYTECAPLGSNCQVRLQHSCQNPVLPLFFGDPALRLQAVIERAAVHASYSICGDDLTNEPTYQPAMQSIGGTLAAQVMGGCMPAPLVTPTSPSSTVVTSGAKQLPQCHDGATQDCWRIVDEPACPGLIDVVSGARGTYRLVFDTTHGPAVTQAHCQTYATTPTTM